MEANILQLVGTTMALVTMVISVQMVRHKMRSRRVLIQRLSKDSEFVEELREYQRALTAYQKAHNSEELQEEIDRLTRLIKRQLSQLDQSDRERIETGLYQSSPVGRVRFVEKIAEDASQLQHA
jgi:hypothetical protein